MNIEWNDVDFGTWKELRDRHKEAKKNKDCSQIIQLCQNIIELDSRAKFLEIFLPVFFVDMGNAYQKLDDTINALKYYEMAKNSFNRYRKSNKLCNTNDWLNDIAKIEKKIIKLNGNNSDLTL